MSGTVYLLDTSFMVELEELPMYSSKERRSEVASKKQDILRSSGVVIVTVPVLLEYARFLMRVAHHVRREKAKNLLDDIRGSLATPGHPWVIPGSPDRDYLLKVDDIIHLGSRFAGSKWFNYSFADLSIIQEAEKYQGHRNVKILTFDKRLTAWESEV